MLCWGPAKKGEAGSRLASGKRLWYNTGVVSDGDSFYGADFKLDVGLYQLVLQVACQRYRQNRINAKTSIREVIATAASAVKSLFVVPTFAPALV